MNVTSTEHKNMTTTIDAVGRSSQPEIQVPGTPFLVWSGSNRHDHSSSSHHGLENLQDDRSQLRGRSRVIVWLRKEQRRSLSQTGERRKLRVSWSVRKVSLCNIDGTFIYKRWTKILNKVSPG